MNTIPSQTCGTSGWRWPVALLLAACLPGPAFAGEGDNFNDNVKSTTKWGTDVVSGRGVLTEKNGRLEYTRPAGGFTSEDSSDRLWKLTRFPYNANWEIQIDTFNITTATFAGQVSSFGINLLSPHADEGIYNEFYASALGFLPIRYGFSAQMETVGVDDGGVDSSDTPTTHGAVQMAFDSATKVITVAYDTNSLDGYQWIQYGSFGVAGSGGTNVNTDWHLTDTDQFTAYIFGYSSLMVVASGQVYGDNFMQTGGVTPSGGPTPAPTGGFGFRFPTNNPLLTAILDISGNYTGNIPFGPPRPYNVDVAQDESGKLAAMGMVEGVVTPKGSNVLAGPLGAVATVRGEPTAKLKTAFAGNVDGAPITMKSTATVPLEITDIGGGTNGVMATASGSGKLGGVPFRFRNKPVLAPVQPGGEDHLHKDWSLQLDLSNKVIKNKERTVASAQLLLPNGDSIAYRERVVRYSKTRGYSLAFTRGTNVTVVPRRIDKKSSITIKRLTFIQSGADWEPTGGIITYKFLGQRGTATNLLEFVAP